MRFVVYLTFFLYFSYMKVVQGKGQVQRFMVSFIDYYICFGEFFFYIVRDEFYLQIKKNVLK